MHDVDANGLGLASLLSALVTLVWFAPSFGTEHVMHRPQPPDAASQR